jgi:Flp pilus assembly protein TadD
MGARAAFICLTTLTLSCASAPWRHEAVAISLDDLLAGTPLGLPRQPPDLADEPPVLAVSDEMREFLDAHVTRTAGRVVRLRQLTAAIVGEDTFGLHYDETTRTAPETFGARRGNCLSFSHMFVALAREIGLQARYQEVDTPPDWTFKDDAFVLNRHVNVLVDLGREGEHLVDFNLADFRTSYERRTISDARALAHHHNNVAVERMGAGDTAAALLHFRRATENDPSFSPAWTNLGTLYVREGHPRYAEAAYLQALRADAGDLVAMSNLANLYARRGDRRRADACRDRVAFHRERNPYYRYHLAREAFEAQDYDGAIGHLRYAIRRKKNEDRFYFLLGLSHLKKGDERQAQRWLALAEEVAATDALKRRYADKLEILLSSSPDGTPTR